MSVLGWRCAVCDATRDIAEPFPWRCPNSTLADRHHVLRVVADGLATREHVAHTRAGSAHVSGDPDAGNPFAADRDAGNPFVTYDGALAWAAFAEANGMGSERRRALVEGLDAAVVDVAGAGFRQTPFGRSDALSEALGFAASGGVWVKDETHAVGGSQKARHLVTILLHLLAAESLGHLTERPRLAIASCGNAALAAATLARAAAWPIDVYVPTWMSDGFGQRLDELGATIHRCERMVTDPPGDPAMLRFRDAVEAGAIPFTVQGPENALCLDGGRTIGWEIAGQTAAAVGGRLDRVFVQVGGGAFATCLSDGLDAAGPSVRLHAVQAEGCAPLVVAWDRARDVVDVASQWSRLMTVWADPHSLADGILDDETYDWIGVLEAMRRNGGHPVVAPESDIVRAHELAHTAGFEASPTGAAGLAGLLALCHDIGADERVAVVMSGLTRRSA